ncbi:WAT1-related protein isoform X1 [Gossypium australe]|uniref:WAT1-related protein isoform X1 n=1 Tax=Gossypium australe TaxID=47621 RepID=A0A5B6WLC5_9ROSI|nr:WAT1-related protein isoform X1 [Gossypium australe]
MLGFSPLCVWQGILGSGLMFSLVAWCVRLKGPLYASVFNPLLLVLVAFAGSFFLEENLYIGSIMGAVLIVMGLYIVLWGKGKEMEMKKMNELVSSIKSVTNNGAIQVIVTSNDATSTISNNDNNSINVASKIPSNK